MTARVKRCFELTSKILNLEYERQQLEEQLSEDEARELVALLDQTGDELFNEAKNLEAYVKKAREPKQGNLRLLTKP